MKINSTLFCLMLLIVSIGFIGNNTAQGQSITKAYTGYIDGKYEIKMNLTQKGTEISGDYYYTKIGTPLKLKGVIDNSNSFNLYEFNNDGNMTGVFIGTINNSQITGDWSKPDGTKTMKFVLIEDAHSKTTLGFDKFLSYFSLIQLPISEEGLSCSETMIAEEYIKKFLPEDDYDGYDKYYCGKIKLDNTYWAIFVTTHLGTDYYTKMYIFDNNGKFSDLLNVESYSNARRFSEEYQQVYHEYEGFKSTISKDFKIRIVDIEDAQRFENYMIINGKLVKT